MSPDPPPASPKSGKGKPAWQRHILRAGALAAALLAIATVVVGAGQAIQWASGWLRGDGVGAAPAAVVDTSGAAVIRSGTPAADQFVAQLDKAAGGGPLKLNHKLYGLKAGPVAITLEYACQPSGRCLTTRVGAPNDEAARVADESGMDGMWYRGCWVVTRTGNGYGAEPLDLDLRRQGTSCEGTGG